MMAEHWHKRQALCLAGQLPDNASDANAVICELQNLVDTWLHVAEPAPPSKVVSLALQLPFMEFSESMGNHDSKVVGADSVD